MTQVSMFFVAFALCIVSCGFNTGCHKPIKFNSNEYRIIGGGFSDHYGYWLYVKDQKISGKNSSLLQILDCIIDENYEEIIALSPSASFAIYDKNYDTPENLGYHEMFILVKIDGDGYDIVKIIDSKGKSCNLQELSPREIKCNE